VIPAIAPDRKAVSAFREIRCDNKHIDRHCRVRQDAAMAICHAFPRLT